jgi:hypothetical protein
MARPNATIVETKGIGGKSIHTANCVHLLDVMALEVLEAGRH